MNNKVFYQHPNLMRALGMHETVMEVMVNVLGGGESKVRGRRARGLGEGPRGGRSPLALPVRSPQEIRFPKMVTSCCRFLCYFCRISRQNQRSMFDHLSYLLGRRGSYGLQLTEQPEKRVRSQTQSPERRMRKRRPAEASAPAGKGAVRKGCPEEVAPSGVGGWRDGSVAKGFLLCQEGPTALTQPPSTPALKDLPMGRRRSTSTSTLTPLSPQACRAPRRWMWQPRLSSTTMSWPWRYKSKTWKRCGGRRPGQAHGHMLAPGTLCRHMPGVPGPRQKGAGLQPGAPPLCARGAGIGGHTACWAPLPAGPHCPLGPTARWTTLPTGPHCPLDHTARLGPTTPLHGLGACQAK